MFSSASLFLNERTLRSFGMNTSVSTCTSDSAKFWVSIPYLENSNSSVAGEDPQKVRIVVSHVVRDTSCLRRYDYL
jgi:hypothetical protein